jgi:hypothetical protein
MSPMLIGQAMHPESLLRIPLVQQMLDDAATKFVPRAVDVNWFVGKEMPIVNSGFNPWSNSIYYSSQSNFGTWLKDPQNSLRDLNVEDRLIEQVLFAVHDYLHQWAYRAIGALYPKIGFAVKPISKGNFEDFVFCHILTEVVATVGLDYWYLATVDLNEVVPIGTCLKKLTVDFHQNNLREHQKFNPKLDVQTPVFFEKLARFYMDGVFKGFSGQDLRRSPLTLKWISHEVLYGELQRKYTRQWMAYLGQIEIDESTSHAKIDIDKPWKKNLIKDLASLLWEKVKFDKFEFFPKIADSESAWEMPKNFKRIDFRFFNVNSLGSDFWRKLKKIEVLGKSEDFLICQILSKYKFAELDSEKIKILKTLRQNHDLDAIRFLMQNHEPLIPRSEIKDLFLIG